MIDEQSRGALIAMRTEDKRVREELMAAGELGGPYVPSMEAVAQGQAMGQQQLKRGTPSLTAFA